MTIVAADLLWPLQVALYQRLSGALSVPVHDGPPEGSTYPYVVLGEVVETPRNAHDRYGAEVLATLHVWSQSDGYKEGLAIAADLRAALDHQQLVVAGHHIVSVRHEQTQTLRDPDPELRHVPVEFRITTEQE